ncbi:MAG TPA: hypothetical protein PK129_13870, partial [Cellvibrionaceae bacterium]|nr:hypothetical protein [Cellvibrionaceae bacterium]
INFLAIEDTFSILSTPTAASAPIVKGADGQAISFSAASPGVYLPNNLSAQTSMKINAKGEWELALIDGSIEVYSSSGSLIRKIKNNYIQEFSYDPTGTKLLKIQDNKGNSLEYFYAGAYLQKVLTNDGRSIEMAYNGLGMLQAITQNGAKKSFHYEDARFPMNLTGITDERGVRFATWKYDEKGRAISSEHAGGAEKVTLAFNADGSTTVTNALGKKTTYSFTDILGVRRVSKVTGEPTASCVGANQSYTYTPQGQMETKTDWNGTVTRFTYDSLGRELTKTEAYGTPEAKTLQTCWHPSLNKYSRIIEPGRIILFEYTLSGQLKSQIIKKRPVGSVDCETLL